MAQCPSTCWYQPCARKPSWWTSACSLPTWSVSSVHQPSTHAWKNTGQSIRMVKCQLPPFLRLFHTCMDHLSE
ncbi:hypothetical protein DPMN_066206 [Dreissena polymorpha]|uniref:Uncharacterized protein n=1 Tax=Dreissena polymorpha TaxID=45954 RepID=A0A9D4BKA2_DREPO|nr:hypothetical protein DPMN_066206 [Dreissena polymorpha]